MTLRRARTWVCDDCENGTDPRDPSGVVCCEHCDEPPCQFVATFEQCSFFTTVTGSYTKEHIKPAGYLYLLKECLRGCKWQAKWSALGDTGGCPAPPESYGIASCWRPLLEEASELGCCWWGGGSGADGNSPCNPDIQEFLWLMWELEITSPTTATLTVTPKTGGSAQYTCDDFDCMARNQFRFDRDGATDNLKFLPCGVCVAPINTTDEMELKCDTAEHQCDCCDPGVDGIFQVKITGCDFLTETNVVDAIRHCDPTPLGTGISYPGDQHGCCVFVADLGTDTGCTVDSIGYTGLIRLIIYCSAADTYKIKVYCQETDLSFTLAGNAAVTLYECRCNGWYIEFTLPDPLPCCCEGAVDCSCVPPATLYADFSSSCKDMNASAVPLVFELVGPNSWSATHPDTPPALAEYTIHCLDGVWYHSWTPESAECPNDQEPLSVTSCDPFVATGSGTIPDPCCPGGASFDVSIME